MYSRVPECQVTTYYYVGFAYLMMRRYQDAIRVFANILLYIQRTKSMFQRTTYKYEMVSGLQVIALPSSYVDWETVVPPFFFFNCSTDLTLLVVMPFLSHCHT